MYIIGTFELNMKLELLISELERSGIAKEKMLAIPLHPPEEQKKSLTTLKLLSDWLWRNRILPGG